MTEKLERPKLPSPVKVLGGKSIVIKVSGRIRYVATEPNVEIKRIG